MQAELFRSACELNYHEKYPHNIFRAMAIIARGEGVRALYRGLTASLIGVLHPLIYFPLYETSKLYFITNVQTDSNAPLESKYVFLSATTCKAFTSLITYPHEVVRAR
jgi:solute carrier family 25 (mitochondrial folate transporter), member 32